MVHIFLLDACENTQLCSLYSYSVMYTMIIHSSLLYACENNQLTAGRTALARIRAPCRCAPTPSLKCRDHPPSVEGSALPHARAALDAAPSFMLGLALDSATHGFAGR